MPLIRLSLRCGLVSVLLLTAQIGVAQGQAPETAASDDLRPGDVLRVTVYGMPELSGELIVGQDGAPLHPLYRYVSVVGLPQEAVESSIEGVLRRFEAAPRFVVERLVRFIIGGSVGQPGFHNVPPGTTVRQGVLVAGGALEEGRDDGVRLVRAGRMTELDLEGAGQIALTSGDEVIVAAPRQRSTFRDVIGPLAALAAVAVSLINVVTR